MSVAFYFFVQFLWFLIAWSVVAVFFVAPSLAHRHKYDVLAVWLAPQLFRTLGVGLLVPNLSPGMPRSFALPTAVGDSLTAILALVAIVALVRRRPYAIKAVWLCSVVGSVDLLIALPHAASIGAAGFLEAQWYVPVLALPVAIVSHVMVFRALLSKPNAHSSTKGFLNET